MRIARSGIPGGRHDGLVVDDLLVLDFDPVSERAARRFFESEAGAGFRPALGIPFVTVVDTNVAVRHVVVELCDPFGQLLDHDVRLDGAGSDAAERRVERCGRRVELRQHRIHGFLYLRVAGGIRDQRARQWTHFHRLVVVPRRL